MLFFFSPLPKHSPNKVVVVGVRFASFVFYLMGSGLLFGIFSQVHTYIHKVRLRSRARKQLSPPGRHPSKPQTPIHNTQVNHFSARCVDAASKPTSWAVRQIETAANFCVDSWFWSLGALQPLC